MGLYAHPQLEAGVAMSGLHFRTSALPHFRAQHRTQYEQGHAAAHGAFGVEVPVTMPVMQAWKHDSPSQPWQAAFAQATGLIELAEPADTILAPAPLPRCGAAGVRLAPRSRLARQSAGRHR